MDTGCEIDRRTMPLGGPSWRCAGASLRHPADARRHLRRSGAGRQRENRRQWLGAESGEDHPSPAGLRLQQRAVGDLRRPLEVDPLPAGGSPAVLRPRGRPSWG